MQEQNEINSNAYCTSAVKCCKVQLQKQLKNDSLAVRSTRSRIDPPIGSLGLSDQTGLEPEIDLILLSRWRKAG
jgi:hypothetical protein